ncbi:3-hydroxyacyl-CoA dehydrogenase [Aquibaculum sediminis]|uniref:3-hydroxyacyl-CoA dehydrogenase n=1 Tax=Aquibaculum sediminis TaxID=3231907 RepID=UPI003455C7A1
MFDPAAADLRLGIVGAGAMGGGIAQVAISAGVEVILCDQNAEAAAKTRDAVFARLDKRVTNGKASAEEVAAAKACLRLGDSLQDFADRQVVIEAIIEDLEIKRGLFRELEGIVAADCVLASNTSSLPIGAIARVCERRERVAGLHFFNPVPVMRLVEVIRGPDSATAVVEALRGLGSRLGRTPVEVPDSPGFLVNLGGRAYTTEGLAVVQEGVATPAQVDAIMRDGFGFRMGPFELMDLTGMDVNFPVTRLVHESFFHDPRLRSTTLHRSLFESGRLGRKTNHGHYVYRDGKPEVPSADAAVGDKPARKLVLFEADEHLRAFAGELGVDLLEEDDGSSPILAAPVGEDCTELARRSGIDPTRLIAIDLLPDVSTRITLMGAPNVDPEVRQAVIDLLGQTRKVTAIADSLGFVAQRILSMVGNLGCEMAQIGLAPPEDIDTAMKLGLNYPKGPLEIVEHLGCRRVFTILERMQALTGDDRYRPSLWLRRRAALHLPTGYRPSV